MVERHGLACFYVSKQRTFAVSDSLDLEEIADGSRWVVAQRRTPASCERAQSDPEGFADSYTTALRSMIDYATNFGGIRYARPPATVLDPFGIVERWFEYKGIIKAELAERSIFSGPQAKNMLCP